MAIEQTNGEKDSMELLVQGLEREKVRLQALVTELLFKNQELRKRLDRVTAPAFPVGSLALEENWR